MTAIDHKKLATLGFEDFRALASDPALNQYEKIGAQESLRREQEAGIFADILSRLPALSERGRRVLEIGPGCSDLPRMLIEACVANDSHLALVDSAEMLALLPDAPGVEKVAARFPECPEFCSANAGGFDVVLIYSVFHYVFMEANAWKFVDQALALLAPGGRLLLGDLPNVSKRKRFFASEAGVRFHRAYMNTEEAPTVEFNRIEPDAIDDAVVLAILMRARAQGFDAYLLPQAPTLPMANRREDILICRP
jgi:hypothetical protein